jgi:amino acid adenylation domain-containing protein
MNINRETHFDRLPGDAGEPRTLIELLRSRAIEQPEQIAYTFLIDGEAEEASVTYAELDKRSRAIAGLLQSLDAEGRGVLLLYPPGLDYIAAFFGCLYAGAIAIPAYPPRMNQSLSRLQAIIADARPAFVLTGASLLARLVTMFDRAEGLRSLRWLSTDELDPCLEAQWRFPEIAETTTAFLQYTSGSTATPKGVMVSHANLLHNERMIQRFFRQDEESIIVGWLPLYHDMGLIGTVLQPLFIGARAILMSPVSFLQRPVRWLEAISRYAATTSGGPNFAYDLCVRKVTPEQRATLNLSRWTVAFNGSEPVRAETLDRFAETFAACGFRKESFYPCYGLAEGTLLASGKLKARPPVVRAFDVAALENHRLQISAGEQAERLLVSCGESLPDQRIAIVDPDSLTLCPHDQVGEIWISGPSITQGYWNQPEETNRVFGARLADTGEGPFLRTGDLGFLHQGELFITGRIKDLIIVRGLNHYPQDIELTVEHSHPALRGGGGAAFSIESGGQERLIIIQELDRRQKADADEVIEAIRRAVVEGHELQPYAITLAKAGTIPKTSSGKIQRQACRAMYMAGDLGGGTRWQGDAESDGTRAFALAAPSIGSPEDIQEWLVSRIAAHLGLDRRTITVSDSLSTYGLDSLQAIELAHDIETSVGVSLPPTQFLHELSIAQVAARAFESLLDANARPAPLPEPKRIETDQGLLSYGQQSIWFLHQLAPESPAYNITVPIRIRGALDTAALQRSFQTLVDRHACLRSTFTSSDGKPARIIHQTLETDFKVLNAESFDTASLNDILAGRAQQPFDLEAGPLLRIELFRRSADEHLLLICVHHIIADFWSLALMVAELGKLYEAGGDQASAGLRPLSATYADFVDWQQQATAGAGGEMLQSFWEKQLSGELPVLNLPTDQPRPSAQLFRGATQFITIEERLAAALKSLSRAHGATLYTLLLAAFETLLYRYTGQEDFVVGTPTSGRSLAGFADVIGYFVNPVALRADLSINPAFEEFLERTRRATQAAFDHQDYPFALLVERLRPDRSLSHSPLLQVMFTLQQTHLRGREALAGFALNLPGTVVKVGNLAFESLALERQVTQFDLTLMMAEVDGQLLAAMQYSTDLFSEQTIISMLDHLRVLLRAVVEKPCSRIADLPLLTDRERDTILTAWNDTGADHPQKDCVHRLFEAVVEQSPAAPALSFTGQCLTYAGLNRRANQLAHYLQAHGAGPEAAIVICAERSLDMVVGELAILKAGAAYVPLDPAAPPSRITAMVDDSRSPLLLTQRHLAGRLADCRAQIICLDEPSEEIQNQSDENPRSDVSLENLAYVIYTSGSTGTPKGVTITHKALLNLVAWHHAAYAITPADRATQLASPAFDASVWELWPYLSAGASIHIPDEETRGSAQKLLNWLADESVTICFMPTPLAEAALQETLPANLALRSLLTGGDKLNQYAPAHLPFTLMNHYGPTEDAVVTTVAPVAWTQGTGTPPIGRPIANKQAYILDAHLHPLPIGVCGELFIGGAGLSRGYAHRPDLTAERFLPNPFSDQPGERLYRTGDLVRYRADGQIEFLGRIDHQVKLRGLRIELGEIESVLAAHPDVRETVVVVHPASSGTDCLVSYVVLDRASPISRSELRRYLSERLPAYMVPAAFVVLEQLPLTPNGKVNRKALPAPENIHAEAGAGGGPRTHVEELIAAIWSQVLKVEPIDINDNFFELGGHSLLATQVVSRVREAMQVDIPLRSLFESPTVAAMAAVVQAAGGLRNAPPITRVARDDKLALSSAQQRLWFLDQLQPESSFYNISGGVRLIGKLNTLALKQSLNEVIKRHEILRTGFAMADGQPVQLIAPPGELQVPLIDLSRLPGEKEARLQERVAQTSQRPFDLSSSPLLRAILYESNDTDHTLILVMHHIIVDGWSTGILIREIGELYNAFINGLPSPLADLSIQYADYAAWQQAQLESEALQVEMAYWLRQLDAAPTLLELPLDHPRPPVQTYRGASASRLLDTDLLDSLKAISRAHSNTLFITLLAAFNALLCRYSGQTDILIGTPVAGRSRVELEGLMGLFVNTLVMRTDLAGNPSFAELAGRARAVAFSAFEHQDVPFELLVEKLQPSRSLSHSPLFQVMFAMQNASADQANIQGTQVSAVELDSTSAKFDLMLMAGESSRGLSVAIEYSSDLFDGLTIERMLSHFERMLDSLSRDWRQRIASIPMLSHQEQEQLLLGWNPPTRESDELCLHHLFERQAALTPYAIALEDESHQLTYEQLQERSSRLANYLIQIGVKPESLVGICMTRGVEMVVAMLAALKAGAAYLPFDHTYPAQRIQYMLEDSGASVMLTTTTVAASLPPHSATLVSLDQHGREIARESSAPAQSTVSAANLAYVIYTSGSTGRPKGVAIEHQSVVRFLRWANAAFTRQELSAVLASTSICFDLSIFEIFAPLSSGGRAVIAQDALQAKAIAATGRVTLINTVPSAMAELVLTGAIPPSVETINLAGEPLSQQLVEQIYEAAAVNRVLNLYGPTEDTTYSTYAVIERSADEAPTIGGPIDESQAYVLGPHFELVPAGVCGELYIGGGGLARGYLNRPELTAERFIPNPYSQRAGERLYRTGDQVRWDQHGRLHYIGRNDNQVKVRGYRIELAEIESVLRKHPRLKEVVVIVREDEPKDKRIVAYVVGKPPHEATPAELREHLKKNLPEYMVPSAFIFMDELPLTLNGKVDRRALPAPDRKRRDGEKAFVAPRTETEKAIASIWSEILRMDDVGIHDDFFEHGGQSLLATRVAAKLRARFAIELPLRTLFEATTVARLADIIDQARQNGAAALAPQIIAASRESYRVKTGARQALDMPEILKKRRELQRQIREGNPLAGDEMK